MVRSVTTIPHVTHGDEVDVTDLEQFRKEQGAIFEKQGAKLTLTAFVVKAVAGDLAGAERAVERGMSEGNPKEDLVVSVHRIFALQGKPISEFGASMERVLSANPKAAHARVALGYALIQQDKVDDAVAAFKAVLAPESNSDPHAVYRAVDALMQVGRVDDAVAGLDQQISDRPWVWELLELRAVVASAQGKPDQAIGFLERAIAKSPRNAGLWMKLSEAREQTGDVAGAQKAREQANKFVPNEGAH